MHEVFAQVLRVWRGFTTKQRGIALIGGGVAVAIVAWLCLPRQELVMLYPHRALSDGERHEVVSYLEREQIPYEDRGDFFVHAKAVDRAHRELSHLGVGMQKQEQSRGFELFDTNTWIKGEKELQVLELRALKGQLEHDLTEFENIKHASVILDLATARTFGSPPAKTKASVILTLMPNAQMKASQLRAISYHLAGAIRGLESHMVAISDTKGRLYQAIDPEGNDLLSDRELVLEAEIEQKIENLLDKVMGKEHFHVSVQFNHLSSESMAPSVAIMLNKSALLEPVHEEIARQVEAIGRGYGLSITPTIDALPFEMDKGFGQPLPHRQHSVGLLIFAGLCVGVGGGVFFFVRLWRRPQEDVLFQVMAKVDVGKLAQSLQSEDPETLALMLSYLEPRRAEEILAAFPHALQEAVLIELEKVS